MLSSVGVVLATTLAGSRRSPRVANCSAAEWFAECSVLDARIPGEDLRWPWLFCVGSLVLLSLPTAATRSRRREAGVLTLCVALLHALAVMLAQSRVPHRSLAYALALHGSVGVLLGVPVGPWFACPELWALRYPVVAGMLAYAALHGPSLSVVQWPDAPSSVTCAALAHLLGTLVPDAVGHFLWACSRWAGELVSVHAA